MKPLFYILKKSLKNTIKEIIKKPKLLIGYILAILFFGFMIAYTVFMPASNLKRGSAGVFGAIIIGILLFVIYTGISQGTTKGSSFFRQADVNFVFPAPLSPQKVLIYGFIQQLKSTLLILIFVAFQLPNAKNFFPLKNYGGILLLGITFLLVFSMSIIGIFTYSAASKSKAIKNNITRGMYIVYGALALVFLFFLIKSKNPADTAIAFFNSSFFTYFPFVGWFKQVYMGAIYGFNMVFFINLFLIIVTLILMMYVMYTLNTDYYEDVLAATEYKEELLKNKKAGNTMNWNPKGKIRKVKHKYNGTGAKAIFYRHILEYKKSGFFFIDRMTFATAAGGVIFLFFMPQKSLSIILYFSIYMLFLFQIQGKWTQELSKPYICLIPASSTSKVFYATLASNIKNLVDGFVLFIAAGVIFKADPISIILCALAYASFGTLFIYADVLSRRVFGSHSKNLDFFLKFILIILIITPGIVISAIFLFTSHNGIIGSYISYGVLIVYNLAFGFLLLFLGRGVFEKLELI